MPLRDSKPQSQQVRGRKHMPSTERPEGSGVYNIMKVCLPALGTAAPTVRSGYKHVQVCGIAL
jgi:hypothetical protein